MRLSLKHHVQEEAAKCNRITNVVRADVRDNVVQVRDKETVATLANKGDRGEPGEPLGPLSGLKKLGDHAEQNRNEGLATW
jgi:hypothetical protein